jgi:plastocyanin
MARLPIINNLRIVPRAGDFLNRKTGSRGEIYFDQDNKTLRAYDGESIGGYEMLTQERLKGVASYEYDVTVLNQGAGNKYVYNGDYYIDLTFIIGYTYIFNQNDAINVYYPNVSGKKYTMEIHGNVVSGDIDYVRFTTGSEPLSAIFLTKYVSVDSKAWFAIQEGAAWTIPQNAITPEMVAYGHFGPGASGFGVGNNILGPQNVTLSPNTTYTMWIQQTGSNETEYVFHTDPSNTGGLVVNEYSGNAGSPTPITLTLSDVYGGVNNQHPLNFSEDNQNGELGGGTNYTNGVVYKINNTSVTKAQYWEQFETATQRSVQITVTNDTPSTLYIWCQNHLNMGRTATVVDPGTGSGGGGAGSIVVAADDSTQVVVAEGNTLQFAGGAGISTASSPDGIITITGTNSFRRFSVGGQSPVDATEPLDTITFTAGSNMIINTDPSTQSIVFNSTGSGGGGGGNSFGIIRVQGETDVVAEQTEDILTLSAGIGISILTNAGTDTVTITNTSAGVNDFDELSEPAQSSHTFDKIYLPAITMLTVTAVGTTAYLYDQYAGNNPTIYAINGTTIAFNLQASGHPFAIQTGAGVNFNEGLIHVSPNGQVNTGAAAQGFGTGTLYWKIPSSVTGGYRYQCTAHAPMVGSIVVKNFGSI